MTKGVKTTSCNGRFAKMAGVFPLKNLYELVTPCPADSSERPTTSASRHHVMNKLDTFVKTKVNNVMKAKQQILIFLCFFFIVSQGYGQSDSITKLPNYQTLVSSRITTFIGNNDQQVESIRIDSSFVEQGDSIFYPFYNIQQIDDNCYLPFSYSWIGKKIIIKSDGYNYFINRNNDTVKINTLAQLNENWIAYKTSSIIIIAKVIKHDTMSFLGQTDSAKTISFTTYNQSMSPISHPVNNMTISISEHFGLLKTINFSLFSENPQYYQKLQTYNLLGMSSPAIGFVNLTWREIYDFEIGDEIHVVKSTTQVDDEVVTNEYASKYIYLDKIIFPDSVIYKVDREINISYRDRWHVNVKYFHDTITMVYESNSLLDRLPGEICKGEEFDYNFYEKFELSDGRIEMGDIIKKILPTPTAMIVENYSGVPDSCWDWFNFIDYRVVPHYLKGLGGPYYDWDEFEHGESSLLQYYKKGDITWGTPLKFTTDISEYEKVISFKIYPNPAHTAFQIKGIDNFQNYSVYIYNMYGQLVMQEQILNKEDIIHIDALSAGVYIVNVGIKDNIVIQNKLIKL